MNTSYVKKISRRTAMMTVLFLIWFGILIFRLVQLQVIQHKNLKGQILRQNQNRVRINPERGTIFGRDGSLFAVSIPGKSAFYRPNDSEPVEAQFRRIEQLKTILGLSSEKLRDIKNRIRSKDSFIYLKRKIDPSTAEIIEGKKLPGVSFLEECKRYYPYSEFASQVLGRVNLDNIGQSGVEYFYDSWLAGKAGERLYLRDAKRRGYRFETIRVSNPGNDLTLSLDETIQYFAARELAATISEFQADWGTVIISQPATGEILAMTNWPEFDLNQKVSRGELKNRNPAIHQIIEPGSTFKIVLAAAALESGMVEMTDTFDCSPGYRRIPGLTIHDHHPFETLTFPEVIIHSSNVGASFIADQIGEKNYYDMIRAFGFGQRTGIDLPAEERGLFRSMEKWSKTSLSALSYGYEIGVTTLQMLKTINVVANRGVFVPFRITRSSQTQEDFPLNQTTHQRILSEFTAVTLKDILRKVVEDGTGKKAQVPGFTAAGKTGTAQKFDRQARAYTSHAHVASFVGFIPAENPVISMIIFIDNPRIKYYGGEVAAPAFSRIAKLVLDYLNIRPDKKPANRLLTAQKWGNGN